MAFPVRFTPQPDPYLRALSEQLQLEIAAELAPDASNYTQPLQAANQRLGELLAPAVLDPGSSRNVLLELEKGYATALAELEQAGYATADLTVYQFWHKVEYLEKRKAK